MSISDTEVVGLKCLSGKTDSKRILLRYTFLGRFPDIDLTVVRNIVRQYKAQVAQGIEPKAECDELSTKHAVQRVSDFPSELMLKIIQSALGLLITRMYFLEIS